MNSIQYILVMMTLILITACGNQISKPATTVDTSDTTDHMTANLPPVEKEAPNTNYPPAFPGQTRVAGVRTKTPYKFEVLNNSLDKPWGIAQLPDGRFLINEKKGSMRIASSTGTLSDVIAGIPAVNSAGQGGLLGLCIDPAFEQNRMVYWVFSEELPDGNVTAVAKGKLSADEKTMQNATVIY